MTTGRERRIVLVTGVGRSGSSKVAGILHNTFGISMGEQWARMPDNFNPEGYYEDYAFGEIIKNLLLDRVKEESTLNQVMDMFRKVIAERDTEHLDWGFKANSLYTCLPFVVELLPRKPIIIRTRRPFHQMLKSWVKVFQKPFRHCMMEILLREHMLDMLESQGYPMHTIWLDSDYRKSDATIEREVQKILQAPHIMAPRPTFVP